jgi:hypothetical protein
MVSVVKMATVLGECTTEEQHSFVRFLWARGLSAKDNHSETFPVYGRKCLSHKAVHNWFEKFSQGRSQIIDDAWPGNPGSSVVKHGELINLSHKYCIVLLGRGGIPIRLLSIQSISCL